MVPLRGKSSYLHTVELKILYKEVVEYYVSVLIFPFNSLILSKMNKFVILSGVVTIHSWVLNPNA